MQLRSFVIIQEVGKSEKNLFSIFEEGTIPSLSFVLLFSQLNWMFKANKNGRCMIILENIDMVFVDTGSCTELSTPNTV